MADRSNLADASAQRPCEPTYGEAFLALMALRARVEGELQAMLEILDTFDAPRGDAEEDADG